MKKVAYIIWQYLIAIPILAVLTLFTAIYTIIFVHWHNAKFVWYVQRFWAKSICRMFLLPIDVSGLENIDPKQSYVCVSNHQSMFDVFLIYGWLPIIFKWLMKQELRKVPFVGTACKAAGHIFINRSNSKSAMNSILEAKSVLQDGVSLVIFPEGTRTRDGEIGRFKRGAFAIASDLNLPILPITLDGCFEALPKGKPYAHRNKISMHIGKPISIEGMEQEEAMQLVRNAVIDGKVKKTER